MGAVMKLTGKTVLLTGASKGLGRQLATQLDARGCRLLLVARDESRLENVRQMLNRPDSRILPCDLGDADARMSLIDLVRQTERRLDLLIHCAGVGSHSRLDQLTAVEIRQVLQLNTLAPLELTAALLPLLPQGETAGIVAIGSVAGELNTPGMSLYSASKAALHIFSQSAVFELADRLHFSLLVVLGAISDTQFSESIRFPAGSQPAWYRRLDVSAPEAASRIVTAIEKERTRLVIPAWYGALLTLSRLFAPVTRAATRFSYQRIRASDRG